MDPYLERPGFWTEVHFGMMAQMQIFLNMHLGPNYRAAIEQRTYLSVASGEDFVGRPDVLVARPPTVREARVVYEVPQSGMPLIVEVPMPEEITERFIEVRDALSGEVITAIEMLSLTNKTTTQEISSETRQSIGKRNPLGRDRPVTDGPSVSGSLPHG
jgi:hypothetical protein